MRPLSWLASLLAVLILFPLVQADDAKGPGGVQVDKAKRTITIDCKIAPRKMTDPKFQGIIYPIEVIACWPYPAGQKAHETVVTIDMKPSEVHKALVSLGVKPGKPVMGESKTPPEGPEVNVFLEVPGPGGPRKIPIERTLVDPKSNKPMPKVKWRFTGSVMTKPDPNKDEMIYGADATGTLIAIFPVTDQTVMQTSLTMKEEKFLKLETNKELLPKEGTPVKLIIEVPASKP
jgi:hypothetical protein